MQHKEVILIYVQIVTATITQYKYSNNSVKTSMNSDMCHLLENTLINMLHYLHNTTYYTYFTVQCIFRKGRSGLAGRELDSRSNLTSIHGVPREHPSLNNWDAGTTLAKL